LLKSSPQGKEDETAIFSFLLVLTERKGNKRKIFFFFFLSLDASNSRSLSTYEEISIKEPRGMGERWTNRRTDGTLYAQKIKKEKKNGKSHQK
jgi:hypothetical protein